MSSADITYTLAPFGKLPYGREIFGDVYAPESDGCTPFQIPAEITNNELSIFILLPDGGCNLKTKALNSEAAGAHMTIIYSESHPSPQQPLAGRYDMAVVPTKFPTVIISQKDGESLKAMVSRFRELFLKFRVPIPKKSRVKLTFHINPKDQRAYQFIADFKQFGVKFESHLRSKMKFIEATGQSEHLGKLSLLLNCVYEDNWYTLMSLFHNRCVKTEKLNFECLKHQLESLPLADYLKAEECFNKQLNAKGYRGDSVPASRPGATVLSGRENHAFASFVTINNHPFRGSLRPENLFDAVCGSFLHTPEYCLFINNRYTANLSYHERRTRRRKHRVIFVIINIVIGLAMLAVVGLCLAVGYKKVYERVLTERVNSIVRDSVINYQTLKNNE